MATILITDDEPSIREGLCSAIGNHGFRILAAENGKQALDFLKKEDIDLLISDIRMPEMDGLELLKEALVLNPELPVILLTAYGTVQTAVEAMRLGAYDFLTKPVNIDQFEMMILRVLKEKKIKQENKRLKKELNSNKKLSVIVGKSKPMLNMFEKIKAVAETKSTVLVTGQSGTGKEMIASSIHNLSARKNNPFVVVNCAALAENLLESELFGHEKGAFTGAVSKKDGRFKYADGGTLFLDEIGELPIRVQVKLLRVLQEKTFEPVGSNKSIKVDVRFIFATNRNLEQLVANGTFREDFYYRLNVIKIEAPALIERKNDIPLLIDHFLKEFCNDSNKELKTFSNEALQTLLKYKWPGNVRELKNVLENLVVFSKNDTIHIDELPENIKTQNNLLLSKKQTSFNLMDNEKYLIIKALEDCKYNKTKASQKLGMSRRTIHRKIKEYGI